MSINAGVLFDRKLCYWVWLTYPTCPLQILLFIAETCTRWLLIVRNVFWTTQPHRQTWCFWVIFASRFCKKFRMLLRTQKILLWDKGTWSLPPLSATYTQKHHITMFFHMKGELRLFTVVNHSTSYSLANIFPQTVFLFCNIAHISSHSLFSSLLNKQ